MWCFSQHIRTESPLQAVTGVEEDLIFLETTTQYFCPELWSMQAGRGNFGRFTAYADVNTDLRRTGQAPMRAGQRKRRWQQKNLLLLVINVTFVEGIDPEVGTLRHRPKLTWRPVCWRCSASRIVEMVYRGFCSSAFRGDLGGM